MWFLKVLHVALCRGSFMSSTQSHKETSQDWLGLHSDPAGRQQHMWTVAHTGGSSNSPYSWRGKNVTILSRSVVFVLLWEFTLTKMSRRKRKTPHAYFIYNSTQTLKPLLIDLESTYPKHFQAWGPQISNAWLRLRAAPWECRPALSLHLPFTKADCQRPAFDICMGLVTRNVGIIHFSLTGPMMYVYNRVVQCAHAN